MYAGTGQNSQSSFYCYQDAGSVKYPLSNGATCTSVYVCDHSPPGISVAISSNENYIELVGLGNVNPQDYSTKCGQDEEQPHATQQLLTLVKAAPSSLRVMVAFPGLLPMACRVPFAILLVPRMQLPNIGPRPLRCARNGLGSRSKNSPCPWS